MSMVTVTVLSDGRAVDPAFALVSLDIRRELNRLPTALLVYGDGDAASRKFPVSDSALFNPGSEIEIKARYEGQGRDQTLFKGLVVRHAFEADRHGSLLRIELRDKAVKLTQPRRSAVFAKMSDSDEIGKLARSAGLSRPVITTGVMPAFCKSLRPWPSSVLKRLIVSPNSEMYRPPSVSTPSISKNATRIPCAFSSSSGSKFITGVIICSGMAATPGHNRHRAASFGKCGRSG